MLAEYFFNVPIFKTAALEMQNWVVIIAAFALALAAFNLIMTHARRVARKDRNAVHSAILVGALLITAAAGIIGGQSSALFKGIFDAIINPLASAMYAMACFHVASAAYRAFRAHTAQAAALLITGILMMLGKAPIGEVIWKQFPAIAKWIMAVPNMTGMRGIMICSALGMIGVGLRVILGIDRSALGLSQE
jgi:hypothetical protein